MPRSARPTIVLSLLLVGVLGLAACGSDTDAADDLSPAAADGRSVYLEKGCAACHGSEGGGQVGPTLVEIVGVPVVLEDGSTLERDREYLVESIVEPSAKIVEGYRLPMPKVDLAPAEIDSIIAYIDALSQVAQP